MGKGVDIDKLLDRLSKGGGGGGSGGGSNSSLTDQQMADKLLTSMAAFNKPHELKVGDFVRYRKECCSYVRNHQRLHIVMGFLDPPQKVPLTDDSEGGPTAYRKYDVVVGTCVGQEEDSIMKYLADSRELELFPEGERLKRQGTA